ncbi:protease htpX-like protein [Candidatus Geothermarchaeota archaeon ex4572_27]|nr:MAG: protease htpX-like protein [Candidatus Geothermarchaeota archaeon ex4572_27]
MRLGMIGFAGFLGQFPLETLLLAAVIVMLGILIMLSTRTGEGPGAPPMASLKLAMFLTAAAIFGLSLLVLNGLFVSLGFTLRTLVWTVSAFVAFFMLFQWLFAPAFINTVYRVQVIDRPRGAEEAWLKETVERLAAASGLRKPPKVGIAWGIPMPNAFAYSSPLMGSFVAVTPSLLRNMPREEVEAVLAHEVGHLKHRDVTMMLAVSFIPVIIYELGRYLMYLSLFGLGYGGYAHGYDSEERGGGPALLVLLAIALLALGIAFHFLVRHFNRLREYYADAHSALTLGDPRPLQRALARLDLMYRKAGGGRVEGSSSMLSMLFIFSYFVSPFYDPVDAHVERLRRTKTSLLQEIFMTHPPIPKRIRFLDRLTT